eukprot:CAMPEP_0117063786 /NCGR_PEP_ID=MMETSP0472-20121206/44529_1 /TAXON_ID=693140 ORGANISM="Tiarina fusus, Strain LIS" /NCGR_SAMPLE_ID=MMETSP0472 /ASSEMBLY_ACC=CAM_ASM_000603 /LENGTH=196 /DNA_ID=CAMNT_0004783629 /DNA_START=21 /DNA_END=608 /DNA_ORIENTATION=+
MSACPISKSDFLESATDLVMLLDENAIEAHPKEFATGSFGWNASGRLKIVVNEIPLTVQVSTNATVLKSKEAPEQTDQTKRAAGGHHAVAAQSTLNVPSVAMKDLLPVNEVLFFPDLGDKNLQRIFAFLFAAEKTIEVCVFVFTDKRLFDVLDAAHKRGVKIRMIVDDQMSKMKSSKAYALLESGVDVRMDASPFH